MPVSSQPQQSSVNLINNFNNNLRNQQAGYPQCVAMYDFEAENPGELSFKVSLRLVSEDIIFFYNYVLRKGVVHVLRNTKNDHATPDNKICSENQIF